MGYIWFDKRGGQILERLFIYNFFSLVISVIFTSDKTHLLKLPLKKKSTISWDVQLKFFKGKRLDEKNEKGTT